MSRSKGLSQQNLEGTLDSPCGRLGHWLDEVIREATDRGDFADLPGKGKPLQLDEPDPFAGFEGELYKYLKKAGFTPEWVELRRQIAAEIIWLRENPRHPERIGRLEAVNAMIDKHNRQIPETALTFPKVPQNFGQ